MALARVRARARPQEDRSHERAARERRPAVPAVPGPEVRIDSFVVGEIDFTYEDRSCEPRFRFPVTSLDVDVAGLVVGGRDVHPVRFDVVVRGGKVSLPQWKKAGL